MSSSPTSNPAGSPKVTPVDPPASGGANKPREFQRSEDLTQKLAQIPKSEVDAERKG